MRKGEAPRHPEVTGRVIAEVPKTLTTRPLDGMAKTLIGALDGG